MSDKLATNFLTALDKMRTEQGDKITIGNIDSLLHHLELDERNTLFAGVQDIASKIEKAKVELLASDPDAISNSAIDANMELEAVVKHTETAANRIMDAAEAIQSLTASVSDPAVAEKISEQVTNLFTACDFQDITGQRISKVVKTLQEIEECVAELLAAISGKVELKAGKKGTKDTRPDSHLMNGPQLDNSAPNQDDIDKLFAQT